MTRPATSAPRSVDGWITVSRLLAEPPDAAAFEAISRASFADRPFAVAEELERPWARLWVAHHRPTGTTTPRAEPGGFALIWHVADEVHLLAIATAEPLRRLGIGRTLLDEVLAYARAHAVRLVLLEVRRSNRAAIRLYRRFGFTVMGLRPNYYTDDGEDALEMVLTFDPLTGATVPGKDEIRIDV